MASRAINTRKSSVEWRAGLRRSMRRAAQMTGAALLLIGMAFLALSLVSSTEISYVFLLPFVQKIMSSKKGRSFPLTARAKHDKSLFFLLLCFVVLCVEYSIS